MPDVLDIIVSLGRIQTDLRALTTHPERYPTNGHFDAVVNLTTILQSEVSQWLHHAERRMDTRRHGTDRRHSDERRQLERRTEDRRHDDDTPAVEVA
jgi:hypothetical protein